MIRKLLLGIAVVSIIVVAIFYYFIPSSEKETAHQDVIKGENTVEAIYRRATDSIKNGEKENAIKDLKTVITQFKESEYNEKALRDLASIYIQFGDYKKGDYYFRQLYDNGYKADGPERQIASKKEAEKTRLPDKSAVNPSDGENKISEAVAIVADLNSPEKKELPENTFKTQDDSILEYIVQPGDSLYKIGRKFNTTVESIKALNQLSSDVIRAGQKLKVDVAVYSIHVDKSDNVLILKKNGTPYKTYRVSTGKNNSTPVGVFKIVDKMIEPAWTKPGVGIVVPEDEEYELGARWIPISVPGYGIHGTNDESTIGAQVTAGCVRMKNNDVIEVYNIITRGTEVEIVD